MKLTPERYVPPGAPDYEPYYRMESALYPAYEINQHTWLISHIAVGSVWFGHSILVIEGVNLVHDSRLFQNQAQAYVGYFHLVTDGEGLSQILCQEYHNHRYGRHYNPRTTASWEISSDAAKALIQHIKTEECHKEIPYALCGNQALLSLDGATVHNCTSWALSMLERAGIKQPKIKFNNIAIKPMKNVKKGHPDELQTQSRRCVIL